MTPPSDPLRERFARLRDEDARAAPRFEPMFASARIDANDRGRFGFGRFGFGRSVWGGAAALGVAGVAAFIVVVVAPGSNPEHDSLYWSTPTDALLELPASSVGTAWPEEGFGLLHSQLSTSTE